MVKRILEALLGLGFILLAVATFLAWNSPTTGYESSIYYATPMAVWICLFLAIAFSIIATLGSLYLIKEHNKLWISGLLLITLISIFVSALYLIRSYAILDASGDTGTHLGLVKDIMATGHFPYVTLQYPAMHALLVQLSLTLGVNPIVIINLITPFWGLLYVAFIYLLAKSLLPSTKATVLITLITACTFFGVVFLVPSNLADLMFPMALFVLFKSFEEKAWAWRILLLLILFFFPLLHQITSVAIAVVLATALVSYIFIAKHKHSAKQTSIVAALALSFLVIWLSLWQLPTIQNTMPSIIPASGADITTSTSGIPTNTSHLNRLIAEINFVSSYGYSVAEQFFKQYGALLVFLALTMAILPYLLRARLKHWKTISLYGALIIIGLIMIAFFFTAIRFGPYRFVTYLLILGAIFSGFAASLSLKWTIGKGKLASTIALGLITLLLLGVATNSVLIKYPSPYILSPSLQNTQAELRGAEWFIDNKNMSMQTSGWTFVLRRYINYFQGAQATYGQYSSAADHTNRLPRHFGYTKYDMIGQNFNNTTYIVLTELNKRYYVDVLPKMATDFLLPSDFDRIDTDPSANLIYTNGGLDIWYAYPKT